MSTVNAPFQDGDVQTRAQLHADSVVQAAKLCGVDISKAEHDIARAFVIGYAAGLEHGRSVEARRTVRK